MITHRHTYLNILFLIVATLIPTSVRSAPKQQAAPIPAWAMAVATEACKLIDQGMDPEKAGEQAAYTTMKNNNDLARAFLKAFRNDEDKAGQAMGDALIEVCPATMIKVGQSQQ